MLTVNLDVKDGLCNGAIGSVGAVEMNENRDVTTLLIRFDDDNTG